MLSDQPVNSNRQLLTSGTIEARDKCPSFVAMREILARIYEIASSLTMPAHRNKYTHADLHLEPQTPERSLPSSSAPAA